MKNKSAKLVKFLEQLHDYIVTNPQFRKDIGNRSESQIQTEIRPLIIEYLKNYYAAAGYKDPVAKANKAFYWEGQEGQYGRERRTTFGSRNYPDFIITEPYLVAIEYKQSESGSTVKQGIGQSIMHTLCEEFHYVYLLFHDQSKKKIIQGSLENEREKFIIEKMWSDYNLFIRFV